MLLSVPIYLIRKQTHSQAYHWQKTVNRKHITAAYLESHADKLLYQFAACLWGFVMHRTSCLSHKTHCPL